MPDMFFCKTFRSERLFQDACRTSEDKLLMLLERDLLSMFMIRLEGGDCCCGLERRPLKSAHEDHV